MDEQQDGEQQLAVQNRPEIVVEVPTGGRPGRWSDLGDSPSAEMECLHCPHPKEAHNGYHGWGPCEACLEQGGQPCQEFEFKRPADADAYWDGVEAAELNEADQALEVQADQWQAGEALEDVRPPE